MPASRIPTRIRQLLSIKAKIIFFPTLITSAIFPAVCVELSLDILYFIVSSRKLFLFYLLATALLLNMVRLHFRLYHNVTRENISDAMTGLYNRKILTPTLEQRLQRLVAAGTSVTFIAIDLDKLKMINDTQGHHEGDRAITLLAKAIEASVRKSDYAIRPAG